MKHPSALAPALTQLRLRHLLLLGTLIECATVRQAAARLSVTQPALSMMLREVEAAFGTQLFVRSRQGVAPTPACHALVRRARVMAGEMAAARDELAALEGGASALLRIGILPLAMLDLVPRAVALVRASDPGMRLTFREGSAVELLDMLREGELDLVVGRLPSDPAAEATGELRLARLVDEPLCVAAGSAHPLAARRKLGWPEALREAWVLPPADTRLLWRRLFADQGLVPPVPAVESLSFDANLALVSHSRLLTIVSRTAAARYEKLGLVKILPVALKQPNSPLSLITRAGAAASPAAETFGAALTKAARAMAARPVRKRT